MVLGLLAYAQRGAQVRRPGADFFENERVLEHGRVVIHRLLGQWLGARLRRHVADEGLRCRRLLGVACVGQHKSAHLRGVAPHAVDLVHVLPEEQLDVITRESVCASARCREVARPSAAHDETGELFGVHLGRHCLRALAGEQRPYGHLARRRTRLK